MALSEEALVLRQATEAQWLQSIAHTHPQWGGEISLAAYTERDRSLREQTGEMGSSLICWVLLPSTSPADSLDFYSSCETYRRPILHLPPSSTSSPNSAPNVELQPKQAERATAYSIASVFTPPRHRRKGYARRMMELLHEELRRSPSPSAASADNGGPPLLSFLYSDVGEFYSTCHDGKTGKGWEILGTERTTSWDLTRSLLASPSSLELDGWNTKEIALDDLPDLADKDAAFLTSSFASSAPSSSDTLSSSSAKHPFLVLPTASSFLWSLTRSSHSFTARGLKAPAVWGFQLVRSAPTVGEGNADDWGFFLLAMDPKEKKAKILRLRLPSPSAPSSASPPPSFSSLPEQVGAHLIRLAASLARSHGMTKLEVWNAPLLVLGALEKGVEGDGGKTEKRKDSESAVAWYGAGEEVGQVDWRLNEGYAWC